MTGRTPEPVAYLVAERRAGRWLLGDEWTQRCDTLAEARAAADRWRGRGGDPADVAVLAITVVAEAAS